MVYFFYVFAILFITDSLFAQTSSNRTNQSASKRNTVKLPEYEISSDTLKLFLTSKGLQVTLSELYMKHMDEQISAVETDYMKYGYLHSSIKSLVDSVVLALPNEAAGNVVELSLGKKMQLRDVSKPTGRFEGLLSPAVEKAVLDLQWSTKNRQPLQSLKAKLGDLDRDLELILTNEANENKLVEEYFRKTIYDRAKQHIEGRMRFALNDNDKLAAAIGKRIEDELMTNLSNALSKKPIYELSEIMSIVEKYFD
jgi:hypothetical protein